jgi:hypothetical protein
MCHVKNLSSIKPDEQTFDAWFHQLDGMQEEPHANYAANLKYAPAPFDYGYYQYTPLSPPVSLEAEYMSLDPMNIMPPPTEVPVKQEPTSHKTTVKREREEVDDALLKKRRKQNEAAQRCRQRKADTIKQFDATVKTLESEKFDLSVRVAVLEKEKQAWISREEELEASLKAIKEQLAAAQSALLRMDQ